MRAANDRGASGADRVGHALGLIAELTSAPTVSKAIDVYQDAIEPFGVRLYKNMVVANTVRTGGEQVLASNWPEEWDAFYQGRRAFTFDPVAAEGLKNDGFYWRDLGPAPTPEGRQLMADAREIGMIDGFTAVRRVPGASPVAATLAGEDLDWSDMECGVVTMVSNTLMSRMLYLREIEVAPAIQELSPRERDIMTYAASGKHDKEIARELELSHETIRFYWKSIRRKLGATDRANAVAVALWSGQIVG